MSDDVPKGPEDAPLREYVKDFPVTVTLYENDKLLREEKINYGNAEHRRWLGKVTYFAISQGYTVETRRTE